MKRAWSAGIAVAACVGIVACGGGKTSDSSGTTGEQKGQYGVSYYVSVSRPVGGYISTADGRIDCGTVGTSHDRCSPAIFGWTEKAVLSARADDGQYFQSWAGDCTGAVAANGCILDTDVYGADKWVVAVFNPPDQLGHSRIPNPSQHAPLFFDFINGIPGAPQCTNCHGQDYKGVANAPSCVACHAPAPRAGLAFAVTSITSTSSNIVVTFTVKDDSGRGLDLAASGSGAIVPRFGVASFARNAATGIVGPYLVRTAGDGGPGVLAPPAVNAPASPTTGRLTGTPGSYTYAFPPAVTFDLARSADTHTLWIQASRQENASAATTSTFTAVNYQFNFLPGAIDVPVTGSNGEKREIVPTAACNGCHDGFRAKGLLTGGVFHGGETVEAPFCAVCHNPASTRTQEGTLHGIWRGSAAQFIHNIHASAKMALPASEEFAGVSAATYPQPVANCTACHQPSAAQGNQFRTRPTIEACGSCHYAYPYPHNQYSTGACEGCHTAYAIDVAHVPFVPRDRNSSLEAVPGNSRTNASALNGAGQVIAGGSTIQALIQSVTTNGAGRPVIAFKLQKTTVAPDGTPTTADVTFNTPPAAPDASKELMNDFVGTIGVYVVFSLPQDGIAAPADFNVAVNSNVKTAWMNLGGTLANVTTLSGPVDGWYSVTFPNLLIPADAVNLTGGIGYAYSLPGTQPLTQVSEGGSAWSAGTPYQVFEAPVTTGTAFGQTCTVAAPCALKRGGAIAPIPNVWKAAGAPRRPIVDTAKCNVCHAMLGVDPTFHVGQRNDAPSCSFCHNPNQNTSGWSSNASTFVHAIHGAAKRTVDYGWAATCPAGSTWSTANGQCQSNSTGLKVKAGFAEVEYPQSPANCGACHADGTDSQAMKGVAVGNLLWTTVASGVMGAATAPAQSPYIALGVDYGAKFGVAMGASGGAPAITPAAGTTLVTSPITAACFSCHDDATATAHMRAMGGSLYAVRSTVSTTLNVETCLDCHGVGKIFDVVMVHR
jgi:OmcA/MtrC family decaheme c-type cytochrome